MTRGGRPILVVYLRSSSLGSYAICPMSHFLSYTLGFHSPSGFKAAKGNVVHKALECLAHQKLALQEGRKNFSEGEGGGTFAVDSFTHEDAVRYGFDLYAKKEPHHDWTPAVYRECLGLTLETMALNGGIWNPLNLDVVCPERYFDITFDEPWASFDYALPSGRRLRGQLSIKGTVDLITRLDARTLHYLDWKTGKRKDWATEREKDWHALRKDPQLLMYYYAIRKLYPEYPHVIMSIVFVRDGGGFSLDFDDSDLAKCEAMLRERFEAIRGCAVPARRLDDPARRWWCERLCHFGRTNWVGEDGDTGRTVCDHVHGEILELGIDRVTERYADFSRLGAYGSGGGRG